MFISHETPAQTEGRLRTVLAEADWCVRPGLFAFRGFPVTESFSVEQAQAALVFVRDEQIWSALIPCSDPAVELLAVFPFHFAPGLDNSGGVG